METEFNEEVLNITEEQQKGPRKNNKYIIIGILILCLLVGTMAYGYLALDWLKSPKSIYLEAEAKSFKILKDKTDDFLIYYNNYLNKYIDTPAHSNMEITASFEGPETPANLMLEDILDKSKIFVEAAYDQKNQLYFEKFDLAIENNKLIGLDFFCDKTKLGIRIPALYEKYAVADLQDRDKLEERFGITNVPNKVLQNEDVYNVIKLTQEEIQILISYMKLYGDCIDKSQVTLAKGYFNEGNTKKDCRVITVTFSEEQLNEMANKYVDTMYNDEKFIDLLYTKHQNLITLFKDAGYDTEGMGLKSIEKDDIKESIKEVTEENIDSTKDSDNSEGSISMVLYVDENDYILDRQITIIDEATEVLLRSACWTDDTKNNNILLQVKNMEDDNNGEFTLTSSFNLFDKALKEGNLNFSLDSDDDAFVFNSDFIVETEDNHETSEINFSVEPTLGSFIGTIKSEYDINEKHKSRKGMTSFKMSFQDQYSQDASVIDVNIKEETDFGNPVELPSIDSSNSIDIASVSDEEIQFILYEIQNNIQLFIMNNENLFSQFLMY